VINIQPQSFQQDLSSKTALWGSLSFVRYKRNKENSVPPRVRRGEARQFGKPPCCKVKGRKEISQPRNKPSTRTWSSYSDGNCNVLNGRRLPRVWCCSLVPFHFPEEWPMDAKGQEVLGPWPMESLGNGLSSPGAEAQGVKRESTVAVQTWQGTA
jgi:hypothetical protein